MATTNLVTNLTLTVVATTPPLTIAGSVTTVSYNLQIACSTSTLATLSFVLERSTDGGITYPNQFVQEILVGGLGAKTGLPVTQVISGEIDNLNVGDKLRARVISIASGTGTWKVTSASITQS